MTTGAIALLIASLAQLAAIIAGVFQVGRWMERLNSGLKVVEVHIASDKEVHKLLDGEIDKLKDEIGKLKERLASAQKRRSGDFGRVDD